MRRTNKKSNSSNKSVDGGAVLNGVGHHHMTPHHQSHHHRVATNTSPTTMTSSPPKKSYSPHHHHYNQNSGYQYIINTNCTNNANRKSPSLPVVIPSPGGKGFYAGAKFESEPRPCAIPSPPVHWTSSMKTCSSEVEHPSDSYKLEPKLPNLQVYTYSLKTYLNIM